MSKGNSKKEMLERFESMGIPVPLKPIQNPKAPVKNAELASKMDQIRNGSLKGNFKTFIEKSEKVSAAPANLPVPKVGQKPGSNTPPPSTLSKPSASSSPQAQMLESMMYGDAPANSTSSYSQNSEVSDFGPSNVDTRARLRERLERRQTELQNSDYQEGPYVGGVGLTEAELNEKITSIAKEVSKQMIKQVMLEMSKKDGGIIIESKTVRKAEIVGKNKVKIAGKTYILRPEE